MTWLAWLSSTLPRSSSLNSSQPLARSFRHSQEQEQELQEHRTGPEHLRLLHNLEVTQGPHPLGLKICLCEGVG